LNEQFVENTDNNLNPKVVVIFAAKKRRKYHKNSVSMVKKSHYKPEVLVVDAHSSDKTAEFAKTAGAVVIRQPKHLFPRKGFGYERRIEISNRKNGCRYYCLFGCRHKKSDQRLGESIGWSNY
jgi:glycosyltransferase involved in cell wall biosynthesis